MFRLPALFFIFTIGASLASAQDDYARNILDTLCSPYFDGRGYVNDGDVRAADFLISELKEIGVSPVPGHSYEQPYQLNVNTFPYAISVVLGDDTLVPGDDYILDPSSGTARGEFNVIEINSQTLDQVYQGKIRFDREPKEQRIYVFNFTDVTDKDRLKEIRTQVQDAMNYFPAVWVTRNKKTYSVGRSHKNYPLIELDSAAYHPVDKILLEVNNKYLPRYDTKNVIGYLPGKKKSKYILFTAHYDHLGRMGADTYFPGANDNASGCTMLLSLAKYYVKNPAEYSIVFCFFSGEEAGLVGSNYFVSHPFIKLKKIKFVLNIDIMGAADKGITVVNGSLFEDEFNRMVKINEEKQYLTEVKKRGEAANSDHYFFTQSGVPAFFIYSMGSVTNYHDIFDSAKNTPLTKFNEVEHLLIDFVAGIH